MARETVEIPLAAGLNTRSDDRALQPPNLSICENAVFTELGGIQKRKPYEAMNTNISGGTTLSDFRKVVSYGDELLCFTKDRLYSWSASDSAWVEQSYYLAPHVKETPRFITTSDQDCPDRAELDGVIVYAWEQDSALWTAAHDKETGAVLRKPEQAVSGAIRPRLLAMGTRIFLFYIVSSSNELKVVSVNPSDMGTLPGDASVSALATFTSAAGEYDVDAQDSTRAIIALRDTGGGFQARFVETGGSTGGTSFGGTCNASIAVSVSDVLGSGSRRVLVLRHDGTDLLGDVIREDLSGVHFGSFTVESAATPEQITAAWENGAEEWTAIWVDGESNASATFTTDMRTIDTASNVSGTKFSLNGLGIASQAFVRDEQVFVWLVFAGESTPAGMSESYDFRAQLQNTYFLYRIDFTIAAGSQPDALELITKAVLHEGGGFSARDGHLPTVQVLGDDKFSWVAGERRVIPLGENHSGYAQRGMRDVVLSLDSDKARRTTQLGKTLYVTGGQISQYDGVQLVELGFLVYPWRFFVSATPTGGNIDEGTYVYKATWRWDNGKGETERSTTASTEQVTISGSNEKVQLGVTGLFTTGKFRPPIAVELWRTEADPTSESPLHLATSKDPSNQSGDNRYIENDKFGLTVSHTFLDALSDEDIVQKEQEPESYGRLANIVPPGASIITAMDSRLFLAGVAHRPHTVWYSQQRNEGEVASFNDALQVDLPAQYGEIVALEHINETLVVFQEHAIHALPGEGFDNTGGGQNFGPALRVSADVGAVSQDALGATPNGILFHSSKGWYVLNRNFSLQYIGAPVHDFDSDTFVAVDVMDSEHQVRCLSEEGRMLVYDWVAEQWSQWTVDDGLDAVIWDGSHVYLSTTGPKKQRADFTGVDYALDVEMPLKFGLQKYGRIRKVTVLGEYRDDHDLRIRLARNYSQSYFNDKSKSQTGTAGDPLQLEHRPSIQKVEHMKVRITDQAPGGGTPTTENLKLTGLSVEFRPKRGNFRLPESQKQ